MNTTRLLIIVPCYNEQEVLPETTARLSEVISRMLSDGLISAGKILYVDDGSRDKTWQLIEDFAASNDFVEGIKLAHNSGHQQALWAGLEWMAAARLDACVSIDADLQDDTDAIAKMVEKYNGGADIVYGIREERKTDTFFKRTTAQSFYKMMRSMGGDIIYNHADFRLMSLRAVEALVSYPERNLFLRGMVPLIGFPTAEVFYARKERMAGESKYPLPKMINFALDGITSFSVKPLRFITAAGIIFIIVALAAIVYGLVAYFSGRVIPGWTSLLVSVWFIGGFILTAIGIIGEYIGKIYKEVKRRPRFFIEKDTSK